MKSARAGRPRPVATHSSRATGRKTFHGNRSAYASTVTIAAVDGSEPASNELASTESSLDAGDAHFLATPNAHAPRATSAIMPIADRRSLPPVLFPVTEGELALIAGNCGIATMGGLGGIGPTGFGGGSMNLTSASFGGAAAFSAAFTSAGGSKHGASRAVGASSLARARPPRALIFFAIASPCFCFMCFVIAASKGAEAPPAPRLRDLSRARTFFADRSPAWLFPELTSSYASRSSAELPRIWDQRPTTSTVRLMTSIVLRTMSERSSDDLVRTLPALDRAADDVDRAPDVPRTDIPGTREHVP